MSSDATPADAKSGCNDGNDDDEDKSSEVTGDGAVDDDPRRTKPRETAPGTTSRPPEDPLYRYPPTRVPDTTKQQPIFMLPRDRDTK